MNNNNPDIKDFIIKCLEEMKAENITCISLKDDVPIADYMIFASGRSVKNIRAIAERVSLELKHTLNRRANIEGLSGSDWILLDADNVIVHLFHPEARDRFKVEELWESK